jgi:hypothetical protein
LSRDSIAEAGRTTNRLVRQREISSAQALCQLSAEGPEIMSLWLMTCRISNSDASGRQSAAGAVATFAADPAVGSVAGGCESEMGTRVPPRQPDLRGCYILG